MDQAVLAPIDVDALAQNDFLLWTHTLFIPSYFALLSILILFAQAIYSSSPVRRLRGEDVQVATTRDDPGIAASATRTGFLSAVKDHVEKSGGSTIFLFQVSRFLVVLTLLGLEIFIFIQEEGQQHLSPSSAVNALSKNWSKKQKGKHRNGGSSLTERGWLDLMLCLTYLYAAFLALVTVTARDRARVGYFVPPLVPVAWDLLRLRLTQHLATAYFHLVACGCTGRGIAMGSNWPSGSRGGRDPSARPAPIYPN